MPYLRRLTRRVTESHLLTRVIAHLSVAGLVAFAAAAGVAQSQGTGSVNPARAETGFPTIVSTVRGAADPTASDTSSTFSVSAGPADDLPQINRAAPAQVPSEPLPTPVAIDPNATPLAAPNSVGAVNSGPTSRGSGQAFAIGGLVWPVPVGSISQYYHAGHLALDIAAPYGSQVVAAQGGVVSSAGWRNNGGGNVISIDHGNGMTTVYNHLGSIWVSPGQAVGAGQGIGGVGCTGMCTGPHVHFEVIVNGVIDNPQRYF
ncbi:MAG: M23 family metallopeptidase [Candidatus Limnocylindria bacterium]